MKRVNISQGKFLSRLWKDVDKIFFQLKFSQVPRMIAVTILRQVNHRVFFLQKKHKSVAMKTAILSGTMNSIWTRAARFTDEHRRVIWYQTENRVAHTNERRLGIFLAIRDGLDEIPHSQ